MPDLFDSHMTGLTSPIDSAVAITPDDAADLATFTRGLYVGTEGDIKIDLVRGQTVTFKNMAAGVVHPIRARRVHATGTTAANIVGVY